MRHFLVFHVVGFLAFVLSGIDLVVAESSSQVLLPVPTLNIVEPTRTSDWKAKRGTIRFSPWDYDYGALKLHAKEGYAPGTEHNHRLFHVIPDAARPPTGGNRRRHALDMSMNGMPGTGHMPLGVIVLADESSHTGPLYPAPIFPVGGRLPHLLAMANFNADRFLDIVTANLNGVSILLNNGDGTFRTPDVSFGPRPIAVAVGDVNIDGVLDIVTATEGARRLLVLLGHGDGTFQPHRDIDLERFSSPWGIALADLDVDGQLDLITVASNGLLVLMGNGDGSFQPVRSVAPASIHSEHRIQVVDLNTDGRLDLVAADFVLLGNGDGTFQIKQEILGVEAPEGYFVEDFNMDRVLDLFPINRSLILFGNGDGTFQEPVPGHTHGVNAVADLNGDTLPDLVARFSIYLGNGDGTFQKLLTENLPGGQSVAIGDVNVDGVPDLAFVHQHDGVTVVLGYGDGTFEVAQTVADGRLIAISDLNGDGALDLVTAGLAVWFGNGDGTFQEPQIVVDGVYEAALGDFNADGHPDLLTSEFNPGKVSVMFGNSDGTFQKPLIVATACACEITIVADLNADDILDLVLGRRREGTSRVQAWQLLLGKGDGSFQIGQVLTGRYGPEEALDLDGDRIIDLIAHNPRGGIRLWRGNGDSTFQESQTVFEDSSIRTVIDVDGDGYLDLLISQNFPEHTGQFRETVRFGNGDGTFLPHQALPIEDILLYTVVADLDLDGWLDLITSRGDGASILLGQGDRTFQVAQHFRTGLGFAPIAIADLNNDNKPDLVKYNSSEAIVLFYR